MSSVIEGSQAAEAYSKVERTRECMLHSSLVWRTHSDYALKDAEFVVVASIGMNRLMNRLNETEISTFLQGSFYRFWDTVFLSPFKLIILLN